MKEFGYKITDEIGIHARPAGMLVKEAGKFSSKITVSKGDKSAEANKLFGIMGLGVKCGDEVTVKAEGEDENEAISAIENFFKQNL